VFDLDEIVNDQGYTKERKNLNKGLEPDLKIPVIVYEGFSEVYHLKGAPEHYKSQDIVKILFRLWLLPSLHFMFQQEVFKDQNNYEHQQENVN